MEESTISALYDLMQRSRLFEELIMKIWREGKISGEMHMGIGEEAINAGIISQLLPGDAIASDHRSSAPFFMRGVDPANILLELMGHSEGLCSGMGGHMHLFAKEHLITTSGIVGAAGPAALGFALAAKYKKQNNIAVAFFGEGALNQGMLLESFNMASAQKLPVLFVCKDNDWAITTRSHEVTGGNLCERLRGFGIEGVEIDGTNVQDVYNTAQKMLSNMRGRKSKPYFIHAHCAHREGHFLGDPLMRFHQSPVKEFGEVTGPLTKAALSLKGARIDKRVGGISKILALIAGSSWQRRNKHDPLKRLASFQASREKQISIIKKKAQEEIDELFETVINTFQEEVVQ
ncbi:MAG: thiamine pyrophosphate-dependent dehydrogenase E1 component subunit alpha [Candidatus Hodarchaeales archaeon]|jgi:pyruvate dehydrogenase E1 component alpha subunit